MNQQKVKLIIATAAIATATAAILEGCGGDTPGKGVTGTLANALDRSGPSPLIPIQSSW